MRGHRQSATRQLNRHYQSGNRGGKVLNLYWHCNYPASAYSPGVDNSNILINPPVAGVIQNIEIDRQNANTSYEEDLSHLSLTRQNIMFALWNHLITILGWGISGPGTHDLAYQSYYYYPDLSNSNKAYYLSVYSELEKYKIINLFCGAFYGINQYNPPTQSTKIFSYFNDENTRCRFFAPVYFPKPNNLSIANDQSADSEQKWARLCALWDKIHVWIPYPSPSVLFSPSVNRLGTATMYDSHNRSLGSYQYEIFPATFAYNRHENPRFWPYMQNYRMNLHIHLPIGYDLNNLALSPTYVREYQHLVDADVWKWNLVPISGNDYNRHIYIQSPITGGGSPGSSSPWYHKTFREWNEIGDIIPIRDIDTSKSIEENAADYARTIT